jgi:hypothetical protein
LAVTPPETFLRIRAQGHWATPLPAHWVVVSLGRSSMASSGSVARQRLLDLIRHDRVGLRHRWCERRPHGARRRLPEVEDVRLTFAVRCSRFHCGRLSRQPTAKPKHSLHARALQGQEVAGRKGVIGDRFVMAYARHPVPGFQGTQGESAPIRPRMPRCRPRSRTLLVMHACEVHSVDHLGAG